MLGVRGGYTGSTEDEKRSNVSEKRAMNKINVIIIILSFEHYIAEVLKQ